MSTGELVKPAAAPKASPELRIEVKETAAGKDATTVYTGAVEGDNVLITKQGDAWSYSIPAATIQELSDTGKKLKEGDKPS